ncbi:MAG: transposase [Pseudomonadota bacterium]
MFRQFAVMSNYRRIRVEGGTYFFTVTLADRNSDLLVRRIDLLRRAWAATHRDMPFHTNAVVILPDHLHAVWTLPAGDADFSERWRRIKGRFSRMLAADERRSASKREKGEKGVWQRRFWEHVIRDEDDFARCNRYCWYNPVKHELVERPAEWAFSSLHRDVRRGEVDPDWIVGDEPGLFGERFELPVGWVATHRQAAVG